MPAACSVDYPLWHPVTQMKTRGLPPKVVRGQGSYLELEDGRRVLDAISSWWVNLHGHCHPRIAEAISTQAHQLEQVIFAGFTHDPALDLAKGLVRHLPEGLTRVFYSDNGSTSVEIALKLALQYWRNLGKCERRLFLSFEGGYHGDTFGAMSVGSPSIFTRNFQDLLFRAKRFPYPAQHESHGEVEELEKQVLGGIRKEFEVHGHEYAGIILEPLVQGAGGFRMVRSEFLQALQSLAREFGVLLIYDEVATGFGRTGDWFAASKSSTCPDIICLSKGITGGFLPLAATVVTDEIFGAFYSDDDEKGFYHSHSYMGSPLGCAAGLASLALMEENPEAFKGMEARHWNFLREFQEHSQVDSLRTCGTIAAMNLVEEPRGGYLNAKGRQLAALMMERGIYIRPMGPVVYVMPPYIVTDEELANIYAALKDSLDLLSSGRNPPC